MVNLSTGVISRLEVEDELRVCKSVVVTVFNDVVFMSSSVVLIILVELTSVRCSVVVAC